MIFDRVKKLIMEQFAIDADTVTPETSFADDLGADSLDIVELTMAIEEEFDLSEMEEEELASMKTVGDVVRYLSGKVED